MQLFSDDPHELAQILKSKEDLGLRGGLLIVNPIPEEYSMDPDLIGRTIDSSIKEADRLGISGKDVTPFLLSEIVKQTEGKSLESNIQLVYNNAKLGSGLRRLTPPCKIFLYRQSNKKRS